MKSLPVETNVLLCDSAAASNDGKMHMLGAGWTVTTSPTAPHALALMLRIPWDRANEEIDVNATLVTEDGQQVELDGSAICYSTKVEVGRPPHVKHGTMLPAAFALNIPPMPLNPGRYQWRVEVDGHAYERDFEVQGAS